MLETLVELALCQSRAFHTFLSYCGVATFFSSALLAGLCFYSLDRLFILDCLLLKILESPNLVFEPTKLVVRLITEHIYIARYDPHN